MYSTRPVWSPLQKGTIMSVARESKPVEPAAPFDPWDSPYWDVWHYEISDPTEVAELERLAVEAETDRHDAVEAETDRHDAVAPWPTDEEIAEFDAEEEHRAAREWFDRRPSFGDWLEANGGPAVG
jgi:hypothetical protein